MTPLHSAGSQRRDGRAVRQDHQGPGRRRSAPPPASIGSPPYAWSYGIAPGVATSKGTYRITSGNLDTLGQMPEWLAHEVIGVATKTEHQRAQLARPHARLACQNGRGPAAYLTAVINRGTAELATLHDGRKRTLAALAYQTGGLLERSGLHHDQITEQLITAGTTAGLPYNTAARTVRRSLARGLDEPLPEPKHQAPQSVPDPQGDSSERSPTAQEGR